MVFYFNVKSVFMLKLINTLTVEEFSETGLSMYLSSKSKGVKESILRSQSFQKYLSYEAHFF